MKTTVAAIDFGTSKITVFIAESGGYHRCDINGVSTVVYDGYMDGFWNSPDLVDGAILEAIKTAEDLSHKKINEINVGVPGAFSSAYTVEVSLEMQSPDTRIMTEDVDALFAKADKEIIDKKIPGQIIHRSPAWFSVGDGRKTMEPVGLKGKSVSGLISYIIANENFLEDVRRRLEQAHYTVKGFYSVPIGEALYFLSPDERDRTSVLIDIGYLNTDIMAVEGDAIVYHEVLPIGGGHIAADLAYGLEVQMSVAEQIKRAYVFNAANNSMITVTGSGGRPVGFPNENVRAVLEPRVDEIADMIKEKLVGGGYELAAGASIYLTGGGVAMMKGGREYISAQLARPVKIPETRAVKLRDPIYAGAVGLLDLIFSDLEKRDEGQNKFTSKVKSIFRNLFNR